MKTVLSKSQAQCPAVLDTFSTNADIIWLSWGVVVSFSSLFFLFLIPHFFLLILLLKKGPDPLRLWMVTSLKKKNFICMIKNLETWKWPPESKEDWIVHTCMEFDDTLILDLQPTELWEVNVWCPSFLVHVMYHISRSKTRGYLILTV